MRLRVLGPLRVYDGTDWVPVRAAQQRLLLAVLAAEAGRMVSTERLVDELWGADPPRTAVKMVHAYVMRVRRTFGGGPGGPLVTRDGGYELSLPDGALDAVEFERLVEVGRRAVGGGQPEVAAGRLTEALALWRGPALADVPERSSVSAWAERLEQARLAAVEDRIEVLLALGRHAEVVDELRRLVEENPLRERLWAHLMQALSRCGRRTDALEVYQRARGIIVAELGLEPGPRLRQLQRTLLADRSEDPVDRPAATPGLAGAPRRPVPAQLPADVAGFTGRAALLARLDGMLSTSPTATAVVIAAVTGAAGVGKTALAVHWAHRVRDRYGDGQLYADLRGYADGPSVQPAAVLARFLRALGVPNGEIPSDVDEAGALYRSQLAGRRFLVLLDNARTHEQVRPLLPGSPGCLAVVTSRDQLAGLVARDGATALRLDPLIGAEAHDLLAHLLGPDRVAAEPAATAELARVCSRLPLALRIAAANLSAHPHTTIAAYTERLRTDLLGGLAVPGDAGTSVRAAFDLSYALLPADAGRMFRLLGVPPGPDLTAPAAAALAGTDPATAERLLDRLVAAHLVQEHAERRYSLHDLLRSYAADRAAAESAHERASALDRLHNHYRQHADAAADRLYPELLRLPPAGPNPVRFADRPAASAWLDAERANLVAAVAHAARHGPRPAAWRLADTLRGHLYSQTYTVDWETVSAAGLGAAEADGDDCAIAAAYLSTALLHSVSGRYHQAVDCYTRAAEHARRGGWLQAEAGALGSIGGQHQMLGQLDTAADYLSRSLAIRRELGWVAGEASALGNLGQVHLALGRLDMAAEHHARAAALYRQLAAATAEAHANTELGVTYHALGRLRDAITTLTQALAVYENAGNAYRAAHARASLAEVHRDLGNQSLALDLAASAHALAQRFGNQSLECVALAASGSVQHYLGDHEQAAAQLSRALTLARDTDDRFAEADLLVRLAGVDHSAGRPDPAADLAEQALALARDGGYQLLEGQAGTVLAATHLARGDRAAASDEAARALRVHTRTGHLLGQAHAHLIAAHAAHAARSGVDTHHAAARALFARTGADLATHTAVVLGPRPDARGSVPPAPLEPAGSGGA